MKQVNEKILQDYFEALGDDPAIPEDASPVRAREMLSSYAEVRFRINGGGRCSMCRAHVRHVLPVHVRRADGDEVDFDCLCQRCLSGEKATAQSVDIHVGRAHWVLKKKAK